MALMDFKIELIPVPVTDVARAKQFYAEQCGWVVDLDRTELVGRGVECTAVRHFDGAGWADGKGGDLELVRQLQRP